MKRASRNAWYAVAITLCFTGSACTPSAEECAHLMPVPVPHVVPGPTPDGQSGCTAILDGVTVTVEARGILRRSRGTIWINGVATPEATFSQRLAQARIEAQIGNAAAEAKGAINAIQETGRELLKQLRKKQLR